MLETIEVPATLRERPRNIEKLRRFWKVPRFWVLPQGVSCSFPLFLHYRFLVKCGQHSLAKEFCYLIGVIKSRWKKYLTSPMTLDVHKIRPDLYIDDFFRQNLKNVSGFCFPRIFSHGPAYMLLTHLHALTGKSPYTHSQIHNDIDQWVSDSLGGVKKNFNADKVAKSLDYIFATWYKGEPHGYLPFREYCNDFYRWGTSGGAKVSFIGNEKYRTKWAWAYSHAFDSYGMIKEKYDLYEESLKIDGPATVALKEEAQKTREIIATPLPSYLRQCYLLYRWGKPQLPSPISSASWIANFEETCAPWYGCVDGEHFDQSVPAWFVLEVIDRLGGLDQECRSVADDELESLKKLQVVWNGTTWEWKGGLLSGWRLTSLIGTVASMAAAQYIIECVGGEGAFQYGAMGDDLILWSYSKELTTDILVNCYKMFGLSANFRKTTSGKIGEFLRKVITPGGSFGYPALALRSIVYANPWISSYSFEKEAELTGTWMTCLSRWLLHRTPGSKLIPYWEGCVIQNLVEVFGPGEWKSWLHTPISAGGGGCVEISDMSEWTTLSHERLPSSQNRNQILPAILGILKNKLVFEKFAKFIPISFTAVNKILKTMDTSTNVDYTPGFKKNVNVIRTLSEFLFGSINRRDLNMRLKFPLGRGIRGAPVEKIVEHLLMSHGDDTAYTSIMHTKESVSIRSTLTKFVARVINQSDKFNNFRIIKPALTLYYLQTYKQVEVPIGTW